MLQKIKLNNFKSHANNEFEFKPGINVILGPMGAGKSSVLQAISFALFGTFSELKKREIRISDLLLRGSQLDFANVELSLSEPEIAIKRKVEEKGASEATIRDNTDNLLAGPNPTQVSDYVRQNLKLDEDIFLRTIYAKQNEIDLFLQFGPAERKTRLDELIGIHKFESARRNCTKLVNQVKYKKETKESFLMGLNVDKLEADINQIKAEKQELYKEKEQIAINLSQAEKNKIELNEKLSNLRKIKEERDKLDERKNSIVSQINEIENKIRNRPLDQNLDVLMRRLSEIKIQLVEKQRSKEVADKELDSALITILEHEKKLGSLEEKKSDINRSLDEVEKIKNELVELEKQGSRDFLKNKLNETDNQIKMSTERKHSLSGEINILEKSLNDLQGAKGTCPVCSAILDEPKKSRLIQERRNRISSSKNQINQLTFDSKRLTKQRQDLDVSLNKQIEILKNLEKEVELRTSERAIAVQYGEVKGSRDAIKGLINSAKSRALKLDQEIKSLNSEQEDIIESKQFYELKIKLKHLKEELSHVDQRLSRIFIDINQMQKVDSMFQEAIKRAEGLSANSRNIISISEEKEKRLVSLTEKYEQIHTVKESVKAFNLKIDFLSKFKNALLIAQESLRKELILAVNEVMADIWTTLYPYAQWTSIRLFPTETDYLLELRDVKGDWVSVAGFASGGERMLASLALRIAFAKIMAPSLSMLILDEPTHNLDEKAIQNFTEVIQDKLTGFLDQIFIVTHDEKLAEVGDNIIKII